MAWCEKAERAKYLNRVGQLNRLWLELHCTNPSCVDLGVFYALMVAIGHTQGSSVSFLVREKIPLCDYLQ